MDKLQKYFFEPKKVDEILENATIVLDTNILLAAYQWKNASFKEVTDILNKISIEDRLKIPSHVIEEFVDQRPKRIIEMIENIDKKIFSKLQKPENLISVIPALESIQENNELEIEKEYHEVYKKYRKSLQNLKDKLKLFVNTDPILKELKGFLENGYFEIEQFNETNFTKRAKERAIKQIPPLTGGDSGKKLNKYGDYKIWEHILSLENDVIFVTADLKEDWVIVDHQNKFISARRELVEEFYDKNRKTFTIMTLTDFIEAVDPNIEGEIIDDIKINFDRNMNQKEMEFLVKNLKDIKSQNLIMFETDKSIKGHLRRIMCLNDPVGLYSLTGAIDEYDSEIETLLDLLPRISNVVQLEEEIKSIFLLSTMDNLPSTKARQVSSELWDLKNTLDL
ncbi:PIN-like domain-containing protein [Alkalihalophilus pseudofirmus]|uniref:PIN-like domain-containing protein n=1 Tax=Alkalihalophilus pseudofirmus TaxID=79885 RepID=A0AAJ2U1R6_ALKPS|nr:PIN-like domain-containing protein [Alkalihalophilus pseudofirmus]MDV2885510.1 PIN-like domain-containing protein [Alkalihalophilus pseudofirmus]